MARRSILGRIIWARKLYSRSGGHVYRSKQLCNPYYIRANGQTCVVDAGVHDPHGFIYGEVIVDDCYGLYDYAKTGDPRVIVDIGGHVGYFSKLASMLFPRARIYCYEPNPAVLGLLKKNLAGSNVEVVDCAVGLVDAARYLREDVPSSGQVSVSDTGAIRVAQIAASGIGAGGNIDFLKIDCEGGEWEILSEVSLLKRTSIVRLEYHITEGRTTSQLVQMLQQGGHKVGTSYAAGRGLLYDEVGLVWARRMT